MTPNVDALRARLQALDRLRDEGTLSAEAHAQARAKLERELVDAVMSEPAAAPVPARAPWRLRAGVAAGVVVLAVAGYGITGSPRLAGPVQPAASEAAGEQPIDDAKVAELVDKMAQRLKEHPDDLAGWTLLARAYAAMGRHNDAVPAYRKAIALNDGDATLKADLADTLAALNDGRLEGEALALVQRALQLEPNNVKALALSGSAAFDQRNYVLAVRQWEQVERALDPASTLLPQVRASIAQARQLGGLPPASAQAAAPPAPAASTSVAAAAAGISGSVSLAPELAGRVQPGDTVFVVARAASGPRMPLAVMRKQVRDLPLRFTLDDSMAMAPTAKISDHAQVVVTARISKSGEAMPRPGDLTGQSAPVAPGATGLALRIAEVVGP